MRKTLRHLLAIMFLGVVSVLLTTHMTFASEPTVPPLEEYELISTPIVAPQRSSLYEWNSNMTTYNCYGFAIGVLDFISPGFTSSPVYGGNVATYASAAMDDLEALGYNNVREVSSSWRPTMSHENLIVIRLGWGLIATSARDFHVMKYDMDESAWLHKIGGSAVLKLDGEPTDHPQWLAEFYKENYDDVPTSPTHWYEMNIHYTSSMVFIAYDSEYELSYQHHNQIYHGVYIARTNIFLYYETHQFQLVRGVIKCIKCGYFSGIIQH